MVANNFRSFPRAPFIDYFFTSAGHSNGPGRTRNSLRNSTSTTGAGSKPRRSDRPRYDLDLTGATGWRPPGDPSTNC